MTVNRSGDVPDGGDAGSWASESLPLSRRRELLERELKNLGFRKAEAGRAASSGGTMQQQQQQQSHSGHPQAESEGDHAD